MRLDRAFIERITDDPGLPTTPLAGTWGRDARHVYSKQQPWNSDNTLLTIENRDGGSPTPLILDGASYRPKFTPCADYQFYDYRWHPSPLHPHEQINVDPTGTELMWFDVVDCVKTRSWKLPITVDFGIGSGEGNPSNDGRFVALGNDSAMFVVDMDPRPPLPAYPNRRIGPVYRFPPCSLSTNCMIGNLSISPSGRYVDVKYSSGNDSSDISPDLHRIYEVDSATLALKPHNMLVCSMRCGPFALRPNGWIFPLKHADMTLNPFDNNEDVIIGGRSCPGTSIGRVDMVRLRDGRVTVLTDPKNEAPVSHVSTRNLDRPGWAYVSYFKAKGRCFSDEIVAVKIDGSRTVERLAHKHSVTTGCYRCESHPVPSRDGRRVLWASNWAESCSPCGPPGAVAAYVVDVGRPQPPPGIGPRVTTAAKPAGDAAPVAGDGSTRAGELPEFSARIYPSPMRDRSVLSFSTTRRGPVLVRLFDLAGRVVRVLVQEPDLAAGRHDVVIDGRDDRGQPLQPGVYLYRLRAREGSLTGNCVILR
ncbi:MAG: hypothetical protein E6K80_09960 [Candidatus Eisenbacteria bacterium]|uniref:T9SS type A sorting domain-containing protein n=1 Tax=Eiseniibacteriota bacterium TaxID=2212470 RepID=A0A538U250_UNCEI|nr:MAG: hypothetical protein E6K80_09960 [Candidatus Eisenbacteria bacterium]